MLGLSERRTGSDERVAVFSSTGEPEVKVLSCVDRTAVNATEKMRWGMLEISLVSSVEFWTHRNLGPRSRQLRSQLKEPLSHAGMTFWLMKKMRELGRLLPTQMSFAWQINILSLRSSI